MRRRELRELPIQVCRQPQLVAGLIRAQFLGKSLDLIAALEWCPPKLLVAPLTLLLIAEAFLQREFRNQIARNQITEMIR